MGTADNFTHWFIWNIPAANKVSGAIPGGKYISGFGNAKQGIGYGWHKYAGPKPSKGKSHIYRFTVYTLDCEIDLILALKSIFIKKARKHFLQKGGITCKFE